MIQLNRVDDTVGVDVAIAAWLCGIENPTHEESSLVCHNGVVAPQLFGKTKHVE